MPSQRPVLRAHPSASPVAPTICAPTPTRNYDDLCTYLKSFGTYCPITESTWAIVTEQTAVQLGNGIARVIGAGDRNAVIRSGREAAWCGVSQDVSDCLQKYL